MGKRQYVQFGFGDGRFRRSETMCRCACRGSPVLGRPGPRKPEECTATSPSRPNYSGLAGQNPILDINELFDPMTNSFSSVGPLIDARKSHTATLLQNGNVLVAGGKGGDTGYLRSAAVYDTSLQTFHKTDPMKTVRALHTATLSTLPAVAFSAIVRGNNNTTGVPLVEVCYIQ